MLRDSTLIELDALYGQPRTANFANDANQKRVISENSKISKDLDPVPGTPEPLQRMLPPPSPFPLKALGPVLGPAAMTIHGAVKSPKALCGQSILAAAALAAQAHADVLVDGRRIPLSGFFITIAASGERKSATDYQALTAHKEYERELVKNYKTALQSFAAREAAYGAARDSAKHKGARAIEALGAPPEEPLRPNLLASEPTLEGLHKLLAHGSPSVGMFSDEGGQFVGGHAMNTENQLKTASGLSKLWDGGQIDRVRAGDGASILYGRRLSLHLLMQPVVAEKILADQVLTGQGLLARCLIAWPSTTAGTRLYVASDLSQNQAMKTYWERMRAMLKTRPSMVEGSRNELSPRTLTLTTDAKNLWVKAHDAIERRIGPGGDLESIRAFASKAPEHALRISGILTLVDDLHATQITSAAITLAVELTAFYLSEAVRLVGGSIVSAETRRAAEVLRWCHETNRLTVHSGEITQFGPNCVREARLVREAMRLLETHGWANPVDGGITIDGVHRRKVWHIHPEGDNT